MDEKEGVFTTNFVNGRAVTGVTWLAPETPGPLSSSLLSLSYPHNRIRYLLSLLHVYALSLYPDCLLSVQGIILLSPQTPSSAEARHFSPGLRSKLCFKIK